MIPIFDVNNKTDILYWYDGPLSFTALTSDDKHLVYYHYLTEKDLLIKYIAKITNQNDLNALLNNEICIRDFLSGEVWIIDVDFDNNIQNIKNCNLEDIDSSLIVKPGVFFRE